MKITIIPTGEERLVIESLVKGGSIATSMFVIDDPSFETEDVRRQANYNVLTVCHRYIKYYRSAFMRCSSCTFDDVGKSVFADFTAKDFTYDTNLITEIKTEEK